MNLLRWLIVMRMWNSSGRKIQLCQRSTVEPVIIAFDQQCIGFTPACNTNKIVNNTCD